MPLCAQAFVSATARWPTPYVESKSTSNHYYSCASPRLQNLGTCVAINP